MKGRVDLSLRLSQVDPAAAKKLRMKKERKRKKQTKLTSDGESVELVERYEYTLVLTFYIHVDVCFQPLLALILEMVLSLSFINMLYCHSICMYTKKNKTSFRVARSS